jgi:HAD superfamily hydrolase (TIGR01549 family)
MKRASRKSVAKPSQRNLARNNPAILFDLDGTLVDTVYQHVAAWSASLRSAKIVMPAWKVHRRIGMSGKSLLRQLLREVDGRKPQVDSQRLEKRHDLEFTKLTRQLELLPGANELLAFLTRRGIRWAIATTGSRDQTSRVLKRLNIPRGVPVVTGDDVEKAKPSPDVFVMAADRLGVPISDCIVIGDSVWDVLAAGRKSALGVGLLSGGYSREELERSGAFRVYSDPADMLLHIEDLGIAEQ